MKKLRAFTIQFWNHLWRTDRYWLTRFVLLRMLGVVYVVAFLVLLNQGIPLIGSEGLTPTDTYLQEYRSGQANLVEGILNKPSIFVLYYSDTFFQGLAWTGLGLAVLVSLGFSNVLLFGLLWILYLSFVHVGQIWYGYGWEMQLLETGFLAIFLASPLDPRPFSSPPLVPIVWLFRWLTFRIMLGSGLIKLRGDACWWNLTCLNYHFETQPLPNPLSWYFHHLPDLILQSGVLFNHLVEVVLPFAVFGPQLLRITAGGFMGLFQGILILSGNLSFLNWLTLVPILACFDDSVFRLFLPRILLERLDEWIDTARELSMTSRFKVLFIMLLVGWLSINPVRNLIRDRQRMNAGFEPFRIVNTYGAFGSIGKNRYELIFKGTRDPNPNENTNWKTYEFKAKPGPVDETPPWVSPYHYRLDWQIWFAAMSEPRQHPWTINLVWQLLHNDPGILSLIETNPFPKEPPRYIKIDRYRYEFRDDPDGEVVWNSTFQDRWMGPLSRNHEQLRQFVTRRGWH